HETQRPESRTASASAARARARRAANHPARKPLLPRLIKGVGRTIQILAVFLAKSLKRATFPTLRGIWRWITVDPYAPDREQPPQAILQGHVLGVYRYQLYQRIILSLLGGIPLTIAVLYLAYTIVNDA